MDLYDQCEMAVGEADYCIELPDDAARVGLGNLICDAIKAQGK